MNVKRYGLFAQASLFAIALSAAPAGAQTEPASPAPVSPATAGQTAPNTGTQAPVSSEAASGRANQNGQYGDIIVTANKRAQSINDVGITIQAADAAVLADRGIGSPSDLGKLVPGFTYTESL